MNRALDSVRLSDFQREPQRVLSAGVTTLAWVAHEAESANDDLTFIAVMNEIERRNEWRIFRDEYMRLWPQSAQKHGYA